MRWLLDQGLPRSCSQLLKEASEDALHVGEIGMCSAPDHIILTHARNENRIVVTLDADFHALLALHSSTNPSVVRIRLEGLKAPALCNLILQIGHQFHNDLQHGCVLSYHAGKVRLRKLPLC